jgi:hypothetical protein
MLAHMVWSTGPGRRLASQQRRPLGLRGLVIVGWQLAMAALLAVVAAIEVLVLVHAQSRFLPARLARR